MKLTENYDELVKFASGCQHKSKITNVYGAEIYVPCGKCKYCRLHKSQRMSLLMSLEESHSRFCYFFTLTNDLDHHSYVEFKHKYSDDYECLTDDLQLKQRINNYLDRVNPSRSIHTSEEELNDLLYDTYWYQISNGKRYIPKYPVLNKDDIIKFVKRVRNELKKVSDEKIRYFIVGEYGPKGKKPHYHGCFYFNSREIQKVIVSVVNKKWTNGNANCSASKSKTASYVASYVNSFVDCPQIYKIIGCTPFTLHSINFGVTYFDKYYKEIYEKGFDFFEDASYKVLAKELSFIPPKSILNHFYPQCIGFNHTNCFQKEFIYTFKSLICKHFPNFSSVNNSTLAYKLTEDYLQLKVRGLDYIDVPTSFYTSELLSFVRFDNYRLDNDIANFDIDINFSDDTTCLYETVKQSYLYQLIYRVLCDCTKFDKFKLLSSSCLGGDVSCDKLFVQRIDYFYYRFEQNRLHNFYNNLEHYYQLAETDDEFDDAYTFYDNSENLGLYLPKNNIFLRLGDIKTQTLWDNSRKHKIHNDVNAILEQSYNSLQEDDLPF